MSQEVSRSLMVSKPCENELRIQFSRPLPVYTRRVRNLIIAGVNNIKITATGAAIKKAFKILCWIREEFPRIVFTVETDTVELLKFREENGPSPVKRSFVCIDVTNF